MKKIKVLTLGDSPLSSSGIGIQSRHFIEGLLKTGRYQVFSFAGAMHHPDYRPIKTEEWGDDWILFPVKDFGNHDQIRSFMFSQKPDILWFCTDPRFFIWLWEIAAEIRENVPLIYYSVWDNFPTPYFNRPLWSSNDKLVAFSDITLQMYKQVSPEIESCYVPLAIDTDVFIKKDAEKIANVKRQIPGSADKFVFLWVNRNARRKHSGTLIWWFKDFLELVGKDKACLIMHTDPKDQFGQDLEAIIHATGLTNGEVLFSVAKLSFDDMSNLYSAADCVVNISDAEGCGLSTVEAMSCEVPIIGTKTGGMQEHFDGENGKTGFWIEPKAKSIVGSQPIPYIYEDRITREDFLETALKMYNLSKEERALMGKNGRELAVRKYDLKTYQKNWVKIMDEFHEKNGSWETRKGFIPYTVKVF
jgi:glycosyltransferase involved in cell wall biosynthesis